MALILVHFLVPFSDFCSIWACTRLCENDCTMKCMNHKFYALLWPCKWGYPIRRQTQSITGQICVRVSLGNTSVLWQIIHTGLKKATNANSIIIHKSFSLVQRPVTLWPFIECILWRRSSQIKWVKRHLIVVLSMKRHPECVINKTTQINRWSLLIWCAYKSCRVVFLFFLIDR